MREDAHPEPPPESTPRMPDRFSIDNGSQSSRGEPSSVNDIARIVNDHIEHVQGWMEIRDGEARGQYKNIMNDIRARDETVGELLGTHHSLDLRIANTEKRLGDFITSVNTKIRELERTFHY